MSNADVAVLGLGNMGAALAQCFIDNGYNTIVWNRTRAKASPFEEDAQIANDAAQACESVDLVVMCVLNYECAAEILEGATTSAALRGKTLVQFTSGAPADARRAESWAQANGVRYVDAAILNYPTAVGDSGTVIFHSGDRGAYEHHESVLGVLGGETRFVGEAVGAALTLDCALLEFYYAASAGLIHAAALCDAEGFSLDDFFAGASALMPLVQFTIGASSEMIPGDTYNGSQCALDVHLGAIRNIQRASKDAGTATEIPDAVVRAMQRAVDAGDGDLELPAIFRRQRRPG